MRAGKMTYQEAQDAYNKEEKDFEVKIAAIRAAADKEYDAWQAARQAEQLRLELNAQAKEVTV